MQSNIIGISEGTPVRIAVDDKAKQESLKLALYVYEGLSNEDIDEIEQIAFIRSNFFGTRSID